jgi:hypothetical protein
MDELTFPLGYDQSGLLENIQMMRHGSSGNAEMRADLTGGHIPGFKNFQNLSPRFVSQSLKYDIHRFRYLDNCLNNRGNGIICQGMTKYFSWGGKSRSLFPNADPFVAITTGERYTFSTIFSTDALSYNINTPCATGHDIFLSR